MESFGDVVFPDLVEALYVLIFNCSGSGFVTLGIDNSEHSEDLTNTDRVDLSEGMLFGIRLI